jgi:hypothetical protein
VNNDDNTGLVLMVPDQSGAAVPLVNEDGDYYEIDFAEASNTRIPDRSPDAGPMGRTRQFPRPGEKPTAPEQPDTTPDPSANTDQVSVLGRSLDEILPNANEQELRTLIGEGPADISRAARQEADRRGLEID